MTKKKKKLIIPFLVDFVLPDSWHAGKRSRFPHKKRFFFFLNVCPSAAGPK